MKHRAAVGLKRKNMPSEADQAPHQIVYASAATRPMTNDELAALLLSARANNKRLGVSGILVHHQGSFLQALEGDPGVVARLFAKLETDPRHHRVCVLLRTNVPSRSFGDWSMGFVASNSGVEALPGFTDFFRNGLKEARISATAGGVRDLLLAFRDGRFRQYVAL